MKLCIGIIVSLFCTSAFSADGALFTKLIKTKAGEYSAASTKTCIVYGDKIEHLVYAPEIGATSTKTHAITLSDRDKVDGMIVDAQNGKVIDLNITVGTISRQYSAHTADENIILLNLDGEMGQSQQNLAPVAKNLIQQIDILCGQ